MLTYLLRYKGWSLRYLLGLCNLLSCFVLLWGRGQRGNNNTCSALYQLSVTYSAFQKQIGPFWCWFPGDWACVLFRTLWVSPTNSPVRLGVSPAATAPTDFYSQKFWGFISLCWNPGLCGLSRSPVVSPGLSTQKCGTSLSTSCHLAMSPLCPGWLPISSPPTSLDECFFFNSLVVELPYSMILCQFWGLFFFFNLLLSFFWFCKKAQCIHLHLPKTKFFITSPDV